MVAVEYLLVFVDDVVQVEFLLGNLSVEIGCLFESEVFYKVSHHLFLDFYLLVLEPTFEHFLCIEAFFYLRFLESLSDFCFRTGRLDYLEPFLFGALVGRCHDFYSVTTVQFGLDGGILAVYFSADTLVSDFRMDVIREIEERGSLGKLQQVALGCEHIDFLVVEVKLELVHDFEVVASLKRRADGCQPVVHASFGLHSLVTPVGCQSVFGYFVHSLGAYLHLHPFLRWSKYGDVQTLVAVRLRH